MGTNLENPHGKKLDLNLKMCPSPPEKELFPPRTDFTAAYRKIPPKSKDFSAMLDNSIYIHLL